MASPFSLECSFEDSRDSRIFATNDDECSGSEIRQGSGSESWQDSGSEIRQGDGVERWQVLEDELESQDTL
jgi:hypothetical protein